MQAPLNIFSVTNAAPSGQADAMAAFDGMTKTDKAFGHWMAQALTHKPKSDLSQPVLKTKPDPVNEMTKAVTLAVEDDAKNLAIKILNLPKPGKTHPQKTEGEKSDKKHSTTKKDSVLSAEIKNVINGLATIVPLIPAAVALPIEWNPKTAAEKLVAAGGEPSSPMIPSKVVAQKTVSTMTDKISVAKIFQNQTNVPAQPLPQNEIGKAIAAMPQKATTENLKGAIVAEMKIAAAKVPQTAAKPQATIPPIFSNQTDSSNQAGNKENLVSPTTADKILSAHSSLPNSSATKGVEATDVAPKTSLTGGGTSAANHYVSAKIDGNTGKSADNYGKFLPGAASLTPRENFLPRPVEQVAASVGVENQNYPNSPANGIAAADSVEAAATTNASPQILERAQDLIVAHVARVSDAGGSLLHVVIEPAVGTQLSLNLHQRDGGIEVQAVLQQGDFNQLNQHWSQLQQQLEPRGVKLASLTNGNYFSGGGHSGGNHSFQGEQGHSPRADLFSRETAGGVGPTKLSRPIIAQTASHRGWESWA